MISHHRIFVLLIIRALAATATALPVSGRLQLANGQPVAGPASLHIEQVGGELGPWTAAAAADGTWSFSDPLLFGNLRITGTLAGHTITPLDVFLESVRSDLNITCVTLTPATTLSPVVSASGARLSGIVGPQSQLRTVFFEWGFTTDYGNFLQVQAVSPSAVNAFPSVILPSTLVPPGRTVHYRLKVGPGVSAPVPPDAFGADQSYVQPFTLEPQLVLAPGMLPLTNSRAVWADFDANGRMDIAIAGTQGNGLAAARVIRLGTAPVSQTLAPLSGPALAVRDYNRDGFPDLLTTGFFANQNSAGQMIKLYLGGAGGVTDGSIRIQGAGTGDNLLGTAGGAAAWIDLLNSGTPGFVLTGLRNNQPVAEARDSNSESLFPRVMPLPACTQSITQMVHVDNDGREDLLIAGTAAGVRSLTLFRNRFAGGFNFVAIPDSGLPAVDSGDAAWVDTDSDGDMDVVLSGVTDTGAITRLYLNDGDGHFTDSGAALTPLLTSSSAWGDVDGDGDSDLIMQGFTGFPNNLLATILYFNQGGNVFTPVSAGLPALRRGSVSWGFWDTDTTLDLLLTGERADGTPFTGVWTNPYTAANQPPSPPPAASLEVSGNIFSQGSSLIFSWGRGSDSATPAPSLTYNVRIGTSPGAGDVFSGNASADRSRTLYPVHGHMQTQLRLTTAILHPGVKYYWSVQAVDAGYAVSPWVDGTPVQYGFNGITSVPVSPYVLNVSAALPGGLSSGEFAFEYSLPEDQEHPTVTPFISFAAAGNQPLTLTQSLTSLTPGRTYFLQLVLRDGQNTYRSSFEVLRTPIEPQLVSLLTDAQDRRVLRYLASPAPAPVVEISADMGSWQALPGGTALGNNLNEFITPPQFKDRTRLFYRVRVGPATAQ